MRVNLIRPSRVSEGWRTSQWSDIKPAVASGRHQWHHPHALLTSPHTPEPLGAELRRVGKAAELDVPTKDWRRCVTVLLKSTSCSPKTSLSRGPWVSLSLPHPLSLSLPLTLACLSVCLSPFPSLAWHIDPLNAFRTSHLTSCMCCFSSTERPLGAQRENLADRFSCSFSFFLGRVFILFIQLFFYTALMHRVDLYIMFL